MARIHGFGIGAYNDHLLVQSDALVASTSANGAIVIAFAEPFAAGPMVVACNGESSTPMMAATFDFNGDHCQVLCWSAAGTPVVNGLVRVNWIAVGVRT